MMGHLLEALLQVLARTLLRCTTHHHPNAHKDDDGVRNQGTTGNSNRKEVSMCTGEQPLELRGLAELRSEPVARAERCASTHTKTQKQDQSDPDTHRAEELSMNAH